jgi:hypothetical protein
VRAFAAISSSFSEAASACLSATCGGWSSGGDDELLAVLALNATVPVSAGAEVGVPSLATTWQERLDASAR